MPGPVMPDPWGPPSIVDLNVYEIPIREVLSRVDSLTAQLGEYAAVAIRDGATSTEDHRTQRAIDILSGAAADALQAWDRWLTIQRAPEVPETLDVVIEASTDKVVDLMEALETSVRDAKAARVRRAMNSDVPSTGSVLHPSPGSKTFTARPTPLSEDQAEIAERHLRLQRGEPS